VVVGEFPAAFVQYNV
jgi:hypothetical protein